MLRLVSLIVLFCAVLAGACTRPLDGDFGAQQPGLAEDEFLWVVRLGAVPGSTSRADLSTEDSLQYLQNNSAFFNQALPLVIRDLLADSIPAYEDYEFVEEEQPVANLRDRLYELGITRQNFTALLHNCDLLTVVKSARGKVTFAHKFLRLVWHDPSGRRPDRNFVCVKISDLKDPRYTFETDLGTTSVFEALRKLEFHFFPVYWRDSDRDYITQRAEEGVYLTRTVLAGEGDKIRFLDEVLNITGASRLPMPAAVLQKYAGAYRFSKEGLVLYLTPEADYLVADWVHRSEPEKVFAFYENAYFTPRGEYYLFPETDDTLHQELLFVTGGDTLSGIRQGRM